MSATKKAQEPGTLVTATITDANGNEHVFHGNVVGTESLVSAPYEYHTGETRFSHIPADKRPTNDTWGEPATWLHIYSATGNSFPVLNQNWGFARPPEDPTRLPEQSMDWIFGYSDFRVRIDADTIDVRVATKVGKDWVQANLSLDNQRTRLIERIKALDPALAEEADNLIETLTEDAYDRGKDAEWRANNY